jgi:hypothetical protein
LWSALLSPLWRLNDRGAEQLTGSVVIALSDQSTLGAVDSEDLFRYRSLFPDFFALLLNSLLLVLWKVALAADWPFQ